MATTAGYVEVGPGKTFTTWSALIADLDDLTGNLWVMQTGNTNEPGTAPKDIDLNGYTLIFDSDTPHYGVSGVGNICQVPSNPGTPIIRLETNGTGTFIVRNMQVDEWGLTDAETAFQLIGYSGSVDIIAHDLIAIGSLDDVEMFGVEGIRISTLNGDIDAWNLKSYAWNDVCIALAPGYFGSGSGRFENLTAHYAYNYGISNFGGFFSGGGNVRNCVSVGNGTLDFYGFNFAGFNGYNNASSDGSADDAVWSGSGVDNETFINPTEFKSINPADASDYLMISDASIVLKDGGSAVQIVDNDTGIRGNARPHNGSYSIGADEYGEVGPGPTPSSSSSSSSSASSPAQPETPVEVVATVPGSMTNMGRTLLLNESGSAQQRTGFAEEYVPPYFAKVELTSGLRTVRRALFGSNPDRAGLNYSIWQYMRLLHSTEYEDWITALDPRITYLTKRSLLDTPYGVSVGQNAEALQFVGTPGLGGAEGRLTESWTIERVSNAIYRIMNMRTRRTETHTVAVTDGITDFMPMTGHTNFKVRVRTQLATVVNWTVQYLAKPTAAMDPVQRAVQASNIGAQAYNELFPARDPYKLFKQLWEQHSLFAYRMSGYLLALIYRTEEIRRAG